MLRQSVISSSAAAVIYSVSWLVLSASGDPPKQAIPPHEISVPTSGPTAGSPTIAASEGGTEQNYVGTNQCFSCHRSHTNTWSETKHPNAFTDLPKKYHNDPTCLSCHVTGFDEQGGFATGTDKDLLMVGCEACHGPGARHVNAAQRFVLANLGEEAQIEKEMRATIVKSPSDSVCTACHTMQAHGYHPAYEGQPSRQLAVGSTFPCCSAPAVAAVSASNTARMSHTSRYNVKTCGGCHYDQYKQWRVEKHSALAAILPAKYVNDESCKTCHTNGARGNADAASDLHHNWIGVACESCHGPALEHVHLNKQFINGPPLGTKLEQVARDSIRKGKPQMACIQCHATHSHKEHPPFDKQ